MMRRLGLIIAGCAVLAGAISPAVGIERFPPPQFETDYEMPSPTAPGPRANAMEYLDVAILAFALCVAAYLILKHRRRRWIFALMLACLAYFGFWRKGCVCAIGSIQNVSLAVADGGYAVPITVLAFFMLPLIFTLLFGRVFCGAVCPLGAIQDVVLLRPLRLPDWLSHSLGLAAWVFLTAAVVFAATGSAFIICQYDPFVGFFRLSAGTTMLIVGGCVLAIGVFVARPYCRFICPLGALMRPLSKLAKFRVTITPDRCIQCRLCEDACPFGAIRRPTEPLTVGDKRIGRGRLAALIVLLFVLIAGGAVLGLQASDKLAEMNYTVRVAHDVRLVEAGMEPTTDETIEAFRKTGRAAESLFDAERNIRGRFAWIAAAGGAFLGLIFGCKLISLSVHRTSKDYTADRAHCLACGRCFELCPVETQRRKGKSLPPSESA